jgi:hypothetical protein
LDVRLDLCQEVAQAQTVDARMPSFPLGEQLKEKRPVGKAGWGCWELLCQKLLLGGAEEGLALGVDAIRADRLLDFLFLGGSHKYPFLFFLLAAHPVIIPVRE